MNHRLETPLIRRLFNLANRISWDIVSNAFDKSINTDNLRFLEGLSFSAAILLSKCITGCIVLCCGRNPYWCSYNSFWHSRYFINLVETFMMLHTFNIKDTLFVRWPLKAALTDVLPLKWQNHLYFLNCSKLFLRCC